MAKSTKYSTLLEILDYELEQQKEYADTASADRFRNLPRTEAPRVINDAIKKLVRKKDEAYTEELMLCFYDSTVEQYPLRDGENFYIDINESVSDKLFTIPKPIKEIKMYIKPESSGADDQRTGRWEVASDSSISGGLIYCPSKDTVYNYNGWNDGDKMRVSAVVYPVDLKNSIGAVTITALTLNEDDTCGIVTGTTDMNLSRGDIVKVAGFTPTAYNGNYVVIYKNGVNLVIKPLTAEPAGVVSALGNISFVADDLIIGIDDGYIRLLTLEIKKMAYSRKQKPLSQEEYIELVRELRPEYEADKGRVNTIGTLNYGGANFGRKR